MRTPDQIRSELIRVSSVDPYDDAPVEFAAKWACEISTLADELRGAIAEEHRELNLSKVLYLHVRITRSEQARWQLAANAESKDLSQWVREVLNLKAFDR